MSTGWARVYRQLTEGDFWLSEKFTKPQAWVDLIVMANHKEGSFWVRGIEVKLDRGEIGWSELTMARRWKWSRNKIRLFLNYLSTNDMIDRKKVQQITTIIKIKNYEKYQSMVQQEVQQEVQQKDNRRYTNNNVKNDKNVKNIANAIEKPVSQRNPDIDDLTSYFLKVFQLPKEDCSIKQSRQYWSLLLKESRTGIEGVRWLIDLARKDQFWAINITSSKDLYYKRVKIISRTRKSGLKIAVMGGGELK